MNVEFINLQEDSLRTSSSTNKSSGHRGYDIMISFHVATMEEIARKLQSYLKERGISAWICLDIKPGEDYRDKIIDSARFSKAFIPLINENWAISKECEYEYNVALRNYNKTKSPIIIPLVFGVFDTSHYNIIEGLLATINVIFVEDYKNEEKLKNSFKQAVEVIEGLAVIQGNGILI